ncbi:hypothetical protein L6164_024617 [Bauhinia variegata]|uniref:Uncharacterized protein n=1 Tax=Bauhinia variegata TaxID=167791 RepID=A0ACB9LZ01_BAUVA|nr:hypothetical protein L6164_024617 [Bauhinia variegata]
MVRYKRGTRHAMSLQLTQIASFDTRARPNQAAVIRDKMAKIMEALKLLCIVLVLASSSSLEARPLKLQGSQSPSVLIYVGGIKTGGPSSGGEGHSFTNSRNLRVTIHSGPSPGNGH